MKKEILYIFILGISYVVSISILNADEPIYSSVDGTQIATKSNGKIECVASDCSKGSEAQQQIKEMQKSSLYAQDGTSNKGTAKELANPGNTNGTNGANGANSTEASGTKPAEGATTLGNNSSNTSPIPQKNTVLVTERVPGGDCVCGVIKNGEFTENKQACGSVTTRLYQCKVNPGMENFKVLIAQMIGYVIRIVLLLAVLAIVGLGIAWAWAGGDDVKTKTKLKGWAINIAIGLAILFFFQFILQFLAPWIFTT